MSIPGPAFAFSEETLRKREERKAEWKKSFDARREIWHNGKIAEIAAKRSEQKTIETDERQAEYTYTANKPSGLWIRLQHEPRQFDYTEDFEVYLRSRKC